MQTSLRAASVRTAASRSTGRRWRWAAVAMLLLAAAATARATYLFWLPCRGSMTGGLIVVHATDVPIADACLRQMDSGTPFPYPPDDALYPTAGPVLAAVAMALVGLAWSALVLSLRWRLRTTVVAVVPSLLLVGLALTSGRAAVLDGARGAHASSAWWILLEVAALSVLVVVGRWQPELSGWDMLRLTVVLWGVSAFGVVHETVDYVTMTTLNTWNWDCPPGCGYPTVLAITVAALAAGGTRSATRHVSIPFQLRVPGPGMGH